MGRGLRRPLLLRQTELEVGEARRALDEALANDPLVQAFANFQAAMRRRYQLLIERNAALSRLGKPVPTSQTIAGMQTELIGLEDYVFQTADRIGSEQVAAEMAEMHASRDAAGSEG